MPARLPPRRTAGDAEARRLPDCESSLAEYFRAVRGAAFEAEAVAGAFVVPLELVGARIDLVFAGTRLLVEVMPALRRFVTGSSAAAGATFHVWDRHTTGVCVPPLACCGVPANPSGRCLHVDGARFRASILAREGPVSVMDLQSGDGVYWVERAEGLQPGALAPPLLTLFHWSLERSGGQSLDVAAVRSLLEGGD